MVITEELSRLLISGSLIEIREAGFYWVKWRGTSVGTIAEWREDSWYVPGLISFFGTAHWAEVREERITLNP